MRRMKSPTISNDVSETILGSIFLRLAVLHRNPGPAEAHGNTRHLRSSKKKNIQLKHGNIFHATRTS